MVNCYNICSNFLLSDIFWNTDINHKLSSKLMSIGYLIIFIYFTGYVSCSSFECDVPGTECVFSPFGSLCSCTGEGFVGDGLNCTSNPFHVFLFVWAVFFLSSNWGTNVFYQVNDVAIQVFEFISWTLVYWRRVNYAVLGLFFDFHLHFTVVANPCLFMYK